MSAPTDLRDPQQRARCSGVLAEAPTPRRTFRVPLEYLVVKQPVPCGMDYPEIGGKLRLYRTTCEDEEPSLVRRRPGLPEPYWELADGRHRFIAALISGRRDLLCTEDA